MLHLLLLETDSRLYDTPMPNATDRPSLQTPPAHRCAPDGDLYVGRERELGQIASRARRRQRRTRAAHHVDRRARHRKDQPGRSRRRARRAPRVHRAVGALLGGGRRARVLAVAGPAGRAGARAGRRRAACARWATARRCWASWCPTCARGWATPRPAPRRPPKRGASGCGARSARWCTKPPRRNRCASCWRICTPADQSSLSLLYFLARQLRPMRALVIGTYRDVEARMDAGTSDLLSRIGREASPLVLPRLQRDAAAQLRQGAHRRGRCTCGGAVPRRRAGKPAVPGRDGAAVERARRRRDHRRRRPRRRARRHSPAPGPARPARRARCWSWPRSPATRSIPRCWWPPPRRTRRGCRRAWPRPGASGAWSPRDGRLRFGHALVREVLYRDLAEDRRRALHGQVADRAGAVVTGADRRDRAPRAGGPARAARPRRRSRDSRRRARAGAAGVRRGGDHAGARALRRRRRGQPAGGARARLAGAGRGAHPARRSHGGQGLLPRGGGRGARARRRGAGRAGGADLRPRVRVRASSIPVLVAMLEESLRALPTERQRAARPPAGAARGGAAAERQERRARARGARGDRDRAPAGRRRGAARHAVRRDLRADGRRRSAPRRATSTWRRRSWRRRWATASACCARTCAWRFRTWEPGSSRRATRAWRRSTRWPRSCARRGSRGGATWRAPSARP